MRIRKPLAIAAVIAASVAVGVGVGHAATPTHTAAVKATQSPVAVSEDVRPVVLPNCEDIEPMPTGGDFTGSCLMWDEGSWQLRVVDTDRIGDGAPYPECATEDSTSCVWDSAAQGNGEIGRAHV